MPPSLLQQLIEAITSQQISLVKALLTILGKSCELPDDYAVVTALQRVWPHPTSLWRDLGLASHDPDLYLLARGPQFLIELFQLCRYQKILAQAVITKLTGSNHQLISPEGLALANVVLNHDHSHELDLKGYPISQEVEYLAIALDRVDYLTDLINGGTATPASWRYCLTRQLSGAKLVKDLLSRGGLSQTALELIFQHGPITSQLTNQLVAHLNGLIPGRDTAMTLDISKLLIYPQEFRFVVLAGLASGICQLTGQLVRSTTQSLDPADFLTDLYHHGPSGTQLANLLGQVGLDQGSWQYCLDLLPQTDRSSFIKVYFVDHGHAINSDSIVFGANQVVAVAEVVAKVVAGTSAAASDNHLNAVLALLQPSRWPDRSQLKAVLTTYQLPVWLASVQAILEPGGPMITEILTDLRQNLNVKVDLVNPTVVQPMVLSNRNRAVIQAILLDPISSRDLKYLVSSHAILAYLGAIYHELQPKHLLQPELQSSLGWL